MKFQAELKYKPITKVELSVLGAYKYSTTTQANQIRENSNMAMAFRAMDDATMRDANPWLYTDPDQHWDLYTLAEKITALEYYFQEWRFKHMKTVARVIGHKPGTGGSSGVNYLVKALSLSFFPELWSMRTEMTAPREGGDYAEGKGA